MPCYLFWPKSALPMLRRFEFDPAFDPILAEVRIRNTAADPAALNALPVPVLEPISEEKPKSAVRHPLTSCASKAISAQKLEIPAAPLYRPQKIFFQKK